MANILMADDESIVRNLVVRIFRRYDVTVVATEDGQSCIDAFAANPDDFALVILDMSMPGLDGLQTMAALREIRADIPVILSSGYDAQSLGDAVYQANTDFVRKPYRPNDLWAVAKPYLEA